MPLRGGINQILLIKKEAIKIKKLTLKYFYFTTVFTIILGEDQQCGET